VLQRGTPQVEIAIAQSEFFARTWLIGMLQNLEGRKL
jgi:hypothetical protein